MPSRIGVAPKGTISTGSGRPRNRCLALKVGTGDPARPVWPGQFSDSNPFPWLPSLFARFANRDLFSSLLLRREFLRESFLKECTPGYYNNEGRPDAMSAKNASYGAGPVAFTKTIEAWRSEGELKGLELSA